MVDDAVSATLACDVMNESELDKWIVMWRTHAQWNITKPMADCDAVLCGTLVGPYIQIQSHKRDA